MARTRQAGHRLWQCSRLERGRRKECYWNSYFAGRKGIQQEEGESFPRRFGSWELLCDDRTGRERQRKHRVSPGCVQTAKWRNRQNSSQEWLYGSCVLLQLGKVERREEAASHSQGVAGAEDVQASSDCLRMLPRTLLRLDAPEDHPRVYWWRA